MKTLTYLFLFAFLFNNSKNYDWKFVHGDLVTQWAEKVNPENVWQEYPRPQMVRAEWQNLNGLWDYAIIPANQIKPKKFDGKILVPFPMESALSGVKKILATDEKIYYQKYFSLPKKWKRKRLLIHFGAVDWETEVWMNGKKVGSHRGGYDAFSFDISEYISFRKENQLVVIVKDPTDEGFQPRGKQVKNPQGIWYTSVSGIWQTVWLEPVAKKYIKSYRLIPNIDEEKISIKAEIFGKGRIKAVVREKNKVIAEIAGQSGEDLSVKIQHPHLWSPEDPYLYDLDLRLLDENNQRLDQVKGYFGMRKISLGKDENGITRIFLNNKPYFMHGPLDQGWWPDGLYTAPCDEALKFDIETTKRMGFNAARKHVKVEPDRWYYWCDKLGLLVWQDMPSGDKYIGRNDPDIKRSPESSEQFYRELNAMISQKFNHPSIVMWVPFNEGWGQFETEKVVKHIKKLDCTRLVNNASGWTDRGAGDVKDIHSYPGPAMSEVVGNRAIVLGEYGGLGLPLKGHLWRAEKHWGYRGYKTAEKLMLAYEDLTKKLQPMAEKGLSAAIYTQTSDVETEVNGLMTYDRAVIKMNPEQLRMINEGYVSPTFVTDDDLFIDSATVEIITAKNGETHFTIDGGAPTKDSPIYRDPLIFTQTTTIRAKTFWPGAAIPSLTREFVCRKAQWHEAIEISNPQKGLLAHVFYMPFEKLPDFSKLQPDSEMIAAEISTKIIPQNTDFALTFSGYFLADADGIYTFFLTSDDGSRLLIDGNQLIDNDGIHGMVEKTEKVALKKGFHKLKLEYFQHLGGLGLRMEYKAPNGKRTEIAENVIFH